MWGLPVKTHADRVRYKILFYYELYSLKIPV